MIRVAPARRRGEIGAMPRNVERPMSFLIEALPEDTLQSLFAHDRQALTVLGAARMRVESENSAPCRISLEDAPPGEDVILASYEHQGAASPYRARGPIFVRQGVARAGLKPGEVPQALRRRPLSIRAYDGQGVMVDADLTEGAESESLIRRLLARADTAYLHVHFARRGCYAAKIVRA
jgi:hypothetical protein